MADTENVDVRTIFAPGTANETKADPHVDATAFFCCLTPSKCYCHLVLRSLLEFNCCGRLFVSASDLLFTLVCPFLCYFVLPLSVVCGFLTN